MSFEIQHNEIPVGITPDKDNNTGVGIPLTYVEGTEVQLTAPALYKGQAFKHWVKIDQNTLVETIELSQTLVFQVDAPYIIKLMYTNSQIQIDVGLYQGLPNQIIPEMEPTIDSEFFSGLDHVDTGIGEPTIDSEFFSGLDHEDVGTVEPTIDVEIALV